MGRMRLIQTFSEPINGYFDGGPRKEFDWSIDGPVRTDKDGKYVKVGSWLANHWFHVAVGKTEKQTLSNARRRLTAGAKRAGLTCTFRYANN